MASMLITGKWQHHNLKIFFRLLSLLFTFCEYMCASEYGLSSRSSAEFSFLNPLYIAANYGEVKLNI